MQKHHLTYSIIRIVNLNRMLHKQISVVIVVINIRSIEYISNNDCARIHNTDAYVAQHFCI